MLVFGSTKAVFGTFFSILKILIFFGKNLQLKKLTFSKIENPFIIFINVFLKKCSKFFFSDPKKCNVKKGQKIEKLNFEIQSLGSFFSDSSSKIRGGIRFWHFFPRPLF